MADQWYYVKNGQKCGPAALAQMTPLVASGEIQATTLVWTEGMANWSQASTVAALAALFATGGPATPQPGPSPTAFSASAAQAASTGARAVSEGARLAGKAVSEGVSSLRKSFGGAVASTIGYGMAALKALLRHPFALSFYTVLFFVAAYLSLLGIVTAILFPMFVMGYLTVLRQRLDQQPVNLGAFITFMRYGWNSVWHLFMMLAAFIVTMSLMLAPLLILLATLYFAGGTLVGIYGTISGFSIFGGGPGVPMEVDTQMARQYLSQQRDLVDNEANRKKVEKQGFFSSLWGTLTRFVWRVLGLVVLTIALVPLCSAKILFFYLMLDVSTKDPDPQTGFNLVYDSFTKMLDFGGKHWKEVAASGLYVALLFALSILAVFFIDGILTSLGLTALAGWFMLVAVPIYAFAFLVYIAIFMAVVCLGFQRPAGT